MILLCLWGSSDSLVVMMVVVVSNVYCSNPISPTIYLWKKENVKLQTSLQNFLQIVDVVNGYW